MSNFIYFLFYIYLLCDACTIAYNRNWPTEECNIDFDWKNTFKMKLITHQNLIKGNYQMFYFQTANNNNNPSTTSLPTTPPNNNNYNPNSPIPSNTLPPNNNNIALSGNTTNDSSLKTTTTTTSSTSQSPFTSAHQKSIRCLEWNREYIVSGSTDKLVRVWSRRTGELIHTFSGPNSGVLAIAFDGQKITAGKGTQSMIFDDIIVYSPSLFYFFSMIFIYLNLSIYLCIQGYRNGAMRSWDIQSGECLWDKQFNYWSEGFKFINLTNNNNNNNSTGTTDNSTGKTIATSDESTNNTSENSSNSNNQEREGEGGGILSSPLIVSWDVSVELWNANTGKLEMSLNEHAKKVISTRYISLFYI